MEDRVEVISLAVAEAEQSWHDHITSDAFVNNLVDVDLSPEHKDMMLAQIKELATSWFVMGYEARGRAGSQVH